MEVAHDVEVHLDRLVRGLRRFRDEWTQQEWLDFCRTTANGHTLKELLHQCPFTSHGYSRPRGYPGDAELIDYLYAEDACPKERVGSAIYRFIHRLPCAQSVRERRDLLTRRIDEVCAVQADAQILSVACGHLREAERATAVLEGRIGKLIAFDQDATSLALIAREQADRPVQPVPGTIRQLLTGKAKFEDLDFIYSAGLYDYLSQSTARRLTARLFEMLKPGANLLIGNFTQFPMEVGYVEAFMDWWLIYRSEAEIRDFTSEIPPQSLATVDLYSDGPGNVIYLSLTRR
jgi:extracellular factor (EF) 3-hydroxypalmitic acid methyl ester biosynthesis protein